MNYRFDLDDRGVPVQDTMYARCPTCGLVSSPTSTSYSVKPDGSFIPSTRIETTCTPGQHRFKAAPEDFLARDVDVRCVRPPGSRYPAGCTAHFRVPAEADQVSCPECHLYQPGPAAIADPGRAAAVAAAQREFGAFATAVVRGMRSQ
jgi:DNA-directed RNA polymerase subunit RPC12/RpoP